MIVFARTKHRANRVAAQLDKMRGRGRGDPWHQRALNQFRAGGARVLVATDIAARGIDVDGVTHVINFELPSESESYIHRIGRTARAGAGGVAISFCDPSERAYLSGIERLIRRRLTVIGEEPVVAAVAAAPNGCGKAKKAGGQPWRKRHRPHAKVEIANDHRPSRSRRRRRAA